MPENESFLKEVIAAYDFPATLLGAVRYGNGHINDTFCVICQPREGDVIRYILQRLSRAAFPKTEEVMQALENADILGGLPVEGGVLWCTTEKISKAELDKTVAIVKEVLGA